MSLTYGCSNNPHNLSNSSQDSVSTLEPQQKVFIDSPVVIAGLEELPDWGIINFNYETFYSGILDTIADLRITTANKIPMSPGNQILVTILMNTGTFEQMFLCTHDSNSIPIDAHYIGKSTMWDNGSSHTIERKILNNNSIEFNHVQYGLVVKNGVREEDTVRHFVEAISIDENGLIKVNN